MIFTFRNSRQDFTHSLTIFNGFLLFFNKFNSFFLMNFVLFLFFFSKIFNKNLFSKLAALYCSNKCFFSIVEVIFCLVSIASLLTAWGLGSSVDHFTVRISFASKFLFYIASLANSAKHLCLYLMNATSFPGHKLTSYSKERLLQFLQKH